MHLPERRCFKDVFTPVFLPQLSSLALLGCWSQGHPPVLLPQSSSSSFVSSVYHVQMPTSGWPLQFSDRQLINHGWVQGQWFTVFRIWPLDPHEGSCCPGQGRGELLGSQDRGFIQQFQTSKLGISQGLTLYLLLVQPSWKLLMR